MALSLDIANDSFADPSVIVGAELERQTNPQFALYAGSKLTSPAGAVLPNSGGQDTHKGT